MAEDPEGGEAGRLRLALAAERRARLAAEADLLAQRERMALAAEVSGVGVWDWDMDHDVLSCDEVCYRIYGLDPETDVLSTIDDFKACVHPDDVDRITDQRIADLSTRQQDRHVVFRLITPAGETRWITSAARMLAATGSHPNRLIGVVVDVTAERLAQEELRQSYETLRQAERLARIGSWRLDLATGSFSSSEMLHEMNGADPTGPPLTPRDLERMLDPEGYAEVSRGIARCTATGEPYAVEAVHLRPDGTSFAAHISGSAERDDEGAIVALYGTVQDVSERIEAQAQLRAAKEAAEAAERAKSDFLATMSHEIRTPMNTVVGMTRLALRTELSPKQADYLEKIDVSAKALLSIINDVLDFSKIEAGMLVLEDVPFSVEEVLETVSTLTALRAEEKGLELAFDVSPEVAGRVRGDPMRLGQVLTNLVGNAIKFTDEGEVVVAISPLDDPAGPDRTLAVSVRDTGIGLDRTQIAALFRPFSQADAHTSRRHGGTGLGLAISRRLVALMGGGEIEVDSTPGVGSTFRFTVRVQEVDAPPHPADLEPARVLVVDDNASVRSILPEMVRDLGSRADAVASGAQGLEALHQASAGGDPYDVVLTDWRMPVMDGLELARRIRGDEGLSRTPSVLMVTAYAREEVLRGVEEIGIDGLLVKPVTASVLFDVLHGVLARVGATPPGDEGRGPRRSQVDATVLASASAALAGRKVMVVDDNALNREVAAGFLALAGVEVISAVDGEDALDRLAAEPVDAVLMDIHMPGRDGLAVTRIIRRHPRWRDLPVIALTAQARTEDRAQVEEAGMDGHLSKPLDESLLYSTLIRALDRTRPGRPPDGTGTGGAGARPRRRPGLDLELMATYFGGHQDRVARALEGFVEDFAELPEALDRWAAEPDLPALARQAHKLRGSVGYLGAHDARELADRTERAARGGDADAAAGLAAELAAGLRALLDEVRSAS